LIQKVNLPGKCASCWTDIISYDKKFMPTLVALDFRMSDFSTATMTFCDECSLKVGKDDFPELEEMIKRGWIISCIVSSVATQDSVLARELRQHAANDWDEFARKHLPLKGPAREVLLKQASPHIRYENGQGIKWATRMPFPILAVVRWRIPSGSGTDLKLTTKSEITERVRERNGG